MSSARALATPTAAMGLRDEEVPNGSCGFSFFEPKHILETQSCAIEGEHDVHFGNPTGRYRTESGFCTGWVSSMSQFADTPQLSWDVDYAGWLVFLHHPNEETFHGRTLEEALAWTLVWLKAPEIATRQILI